MGVDIILRYSKDIVFLGGLFPKDKENNIIQNSIGSIQNAANALQWKFVEGLDCNNKKPIKIINSLYIGSYPKRYKKALIKTYKFSHCKNADDINVGFFNLFGIKNIFRYISLKPVLKKWAKDQKEEKLIIAYALTNTFVRCLKYVKKINPNIKTCIIVPDLPEYMNTSKHVSFIYKILKKLDIKSINSNLDHIDGFVLLTEQMSEKLNVNNYVVIEGIATNEFDYLDSECILNKDNINIVYTGTMNEKYGILNLIEAFEGIENPKYRLILCGDGDSVQQVKEACIRDNRIIFKGLLKRDEVLKLQRNATVLVNPRQNNEEFTKYSFPSKNLEYLSSGTPLIAYKLDGIPNEYNEYIFYVEDESIELLKRKIINICEKNEQELDEFGKVAQKFVLNEKNNKYQCKKIIDMINNI